MSPVMLLVTFLGIFGAIFGLLILAMRVMSRRQALAVADGLAEPVADGQQPGRVAAGSDDDDEPLDPKLEALATRLRHAGIDLEPERYRKRVLHLTILVMLAGMIMGGFGAGGAVFAVVLGLSCYKGSDVFIDFKYNQRMAEFTDQFSDALGVMANAAKSGQTVLQALEVVGKDFDDPLQSEVEEVLGELRMGVPLDEALESWVRRMPGEDLEIACTALAVQRQTGGNVAEILDTVALTIRERNKLHKQIRALTATGRMSGWVMSLLPVGMFLAMYFIAPARMRLLLTNPIGMGLTGLGIGAIMLGSYFIKKIVTIEV